MKYLPIIFFDLSTTHSKLLDLTNSTLKFFLYATSAILLAQAYSISNLHRFLSLATPLHHQCCKSRYYYTLPLLKKTLVASTALKNKKQLHNLGLIASSSHILHRPSIKTLWLGAAQIRPYKAWSTTIKIWVSVLKIMVN